MEAIKFVPVSVLIPTMNRPETLKRTLDSYLKAEYLPKQIVIVDQSQDISVAKEIERTVQSYDCNNIDTKYIYKPVPSLTAARNTAFKYATEEILICSDDDVDVHSDTIYNVYKLMCDATIAMVAGLDDNAVGKKNSMLGFFLGTRSYKKRNIGHVTASMLGRFPDHVDGQVETEWAMGFFFSIKRSLVERWNLKWDENLSSYAYAEDLDFSYSYYKNASANKLRCIYDEKIRVNHMASAEYRIPSRKATYMYVINRAYLSYKHKMGLKSRLAMDWCDFWKLVERILRRERPLDFIFAKISQRKNLAKVMVGEIWDLY